MSSKTARFTTAVAIALALSLTASCGDDDKPDPIPKASPTKTTPSVLPAPTDVPELNAEQKKDYADAVQKYAEYQRLVDKVGMDPKVTDEIALALAKVATKPATSEFSDGLDELIQNDVHTEGSREVAWSRPVSVKATKEVVFQQCETPGNWVAIRGDKRTMDKTNTLSKVIVINYKSNWFVKDTEVEGEC